jgi:multimeric flavodoxin WrbA/putative sterol carrier protein
MKLKNILFITSFVPVIIFKLVLARVGWSTFTQAQIATVTGLILAAIQFTLSRQLLKRATYQEKAFLGFLGFGTVWVYLTPPPLSSLFVEHSTTLLYSVLFLTTLLPQLFGYDPFTYVVAKQWYPETVWKVPQFRLINLHITYVWSGLFFFSALSSWLGHGKPVFYILIPLILLFGIGLPFSKKYPDYYLKRAFTTQPVDPSFFPPTARELISRMPLGFDPAVAKDLKAEIQFVLSGEGGGEMALSIAGGKCAFREGKTPTPTLAIYSSGDVWLKMAKGEISRPKALMEGLYRVEGDMSLLMKMGDLFRAPTKAKEEFIKEGEKKMLKILAIQGSPRPKVSNTDVLLQEFLRGAQSQGAESETVYLKQKDIHPCVGCYTCWTKTPGVCIFKDDMPELLEKVRSSDIMVYSTPLYYYNMTSLLKAFQDRLLPLSDPHLIKRGDTYRHPSRYQGKQKMVLVSTCGFPEISHFDGLRQIFHHWGNGQVPLIGELLMPGAELLKQEMLKEKAQVTLNAAYQAGVEVVRDGRVSKETEAEIQNPLLKPDEMAELANLWWDSYLEGFAQGKPQEGGKVEDMRLLLRGMAATFNPQAAGNLKATIQFEVSGKQPGNWFFSIENGRCSYHEGKANSANLVIQTPSEVWLAISNNELDGQQAFMDGKYSVQGDVGLLIKMRNLFGDAK